MKTLKISTLPVQLQAKIREELQVIAGTYNTSSLPIISSRDLRTLVRDYLYTSNLNLTKEEELALGKGEIFGIFIKNSQSKKYEVILAKMCNLYRVKKTLTRYLEEEANKNSYTDQEYYQEYLTSISRSIPIQNRILCTRQGVNFLANKYRPISTNLSRR